MVTMFAHAQVAANIYWVQFTDKANSPYSIDNPEAFLSERALQRRANLGIAIDEYDLPVNPQYLQAVADCGAELINPSKWLNGVSIRTTDASVIDAINALEFVSAVRYCPNDPEAQKRKERWMANEMKPAAPQRITNDFYGGASAQVTQLNANVLHDMVSMARASSSPFLTVVSMAPPTNRVSMPCATKAVCSARVSSSTDRPRSIRRAPTARRA